MESVLFLIDKAEVTEITALKIAWTLVLGQAFCADLMRYELLFYLLRYALLFYFTAAKSVGG
jgi:hypothetical protein